MWPRHVGLKCWYGVHTHHVPELGSCYGTLNAYQACIRWVLKGVRSSIADQLILFADSGKCPLQLPSRPRNFWKYFSTHDGARVLTHIFKSCLAIPANNADFSRKTLSSSVAHKFRPEYLGGHWHISCTTDPDNNTCKGTPQNAWDYLTTKFVILAVYTATNSIQCRG
jgi:hypothetical protein